MSGHQLFIDLETRSTSDLKKVGVYVYAKNPETDIWCVALAQDDQEICLWVPGEPCPTEVQSAVANGYQIVAHNAQFERIMWREILSPRYGWPEPKLLQWRCTMAMALAMSLPAGLGNAAAAVGLEYDKDMKGHRLMLQLCRPRSIQEDGEIVWWDDADRQKRLQEYCRTDVKVERALFNRLLPLRGQEKDIWILDQIINDRGIQIDLSLVDSAESIVANTTVELNERMRIVTNGAVTACTNTGQLTGWLRSQGVETTSVAKPVLPELLEQDIPDAARSAIKLRQEAARSSTAKLKTMRSATGSDGRARGLFQYHAASTGRFGGRLIQVHNLPRPDLSINEINGALNIIRDRDHHLLDLLYGPPMDVVSSCLRSMLTVPSGKELYVADFSAIEARVVAWLAGEEKVLEVFRGDGKIYEHAAAGIYGVDINNVTKDQRFVGKLSILSLGYQGGIVAFQSMARNYGVDISEDKANEIKTAWRKANANIVRFWKLLENAAIKAIQSPCANAHANDKIIFRVAGSFLWCRLPSGRALCYPYPKVTSKQTPWGEMRPMVIYKGVEGISKKWKEQDAYGGRWAENVTQAVARDIMVEAMVRVEQAGYPIVLTCHDEVVSEVPIDFGSIDEFFELMCVVPAWANGLPLSADGYRGTRYRK